jgi:hypothetical protein
VSYLISKILLVNRPELAEEFVQRNEGPLISLLERSTMPDRFWLLWNIYQSKPELAKSLVQAGSVSLDLLPGDALWLPCLGLLSLCGRAPISVPARTDEELKSELKRRDSPSLLGLSLRGIEASVPLERRTTLLNAQALREIRDRLRTFPTLSTRQLLLAILDRFERGT